MLSDYLELTLTIEGLDSQNIRKVSYIHYLDIVSLRFFLLCWTKKIVIVIKHVPLNPNSIGSPFL